MVIYRADYEQRKINEQITVPKPGACPGGGGPKGPGPPPLESKKKKKRSSEQILSYFTYILLLF